jgi:NAD(P)-dependent dehydrogenase (short-subunit alcohol dehydrogenase family)
MSDKKQQSSQGQGRAIGAGLVDAFVKEGYNVVATSLNVNESCEAS